MMNFRKLLILIPLLLVISIIVPWSTGHAQSFFDSVTLGLEKEVGNESYQDIISKNKIVELPQDQAKHLQRIFKRLVNTCSRKDELNFDLTVIENDTVNAFALPGGHVFVHTGLLSFVRSDGEIAGVLGHEIAHIDRRHSMQSIERSVGLSLLLQLILSDKDSNIGDQIQKIGAIAINLAQLGYSRENEFEADHYGAIFMTKAGYKKIEMINFFRRLESKSPSNPEFMQFLSSHPPTSERIKRIQAMKI